MVLLTISVVANDKVKNLKFEATQEHNTITEINKKKATSNQIDRNFKVIVWNIFKGVKTDLYKEFNRMCHEYDLLILQEAYSTKEMNAMFEKSPHHFTMASAFIYKPQNLYSGVITGSKFQHTKYEVIRGKYKEPLIDAPKLSLMSYFKIKGHKEELLVVNVHAVNFVPMSHLFEQLDGIYNYIKKHKGPVILAGDFNAWKESSVKYLDRMAKKLALTEAKYDPDHRKRFVKKPLDYLYYRGIKLKDAKTLNLPHLSDHNPIIAEFEL